MKNLLDEFNEIENKDTDKIDKLLEKANNLLKENEKLIDDSEKRKASQIKKEEISQLSNEQYEQLIKHIENWGYETAFKLSGGSPNITMKTTTLAELFKSIYIAGMKGD